jgi:hypothetical protein
MIMIMIYESVLYLYDAEKPLGSQLNSNSLSAPHLPPQTVNTKKDFRLKPQYLDSISSESEPTREMGNLISLFCLFYIKVN